MTQSIVRIYEPFASLNVVVLACGHKQLADSTDRVGGHAHCPTCR